MSTLLVILSTWLHMLATVLMFGYYVLLVLVFLPVLKNKAHGAELRDLLKDISKRLQPYFGGALLIFLVTGTYLMMINPNYLGLGHFFDNPWSVVIVVKHVLVLVFLAIGITADRMYVDKISDDQPQVLKRYEASLYLDLALGLLILLLTAAAQVA
jgi:uncharacterized membrane protein